MLNMENPSLFTRIVLAGLALLALAPGASFGQFGYVPQTVSTAPASNTIGASLASTPAESSGFGIPRSGTFFQFEGATFSVGGIPKEAQEIVSTMNADTTYGFMGTVGHIGKSGLGFELSGGYFTMNFSGGVNNLYQKYNADVDVKLTLVPIFLGARYSLGLTRSVSLEVGVGVGGVYANAEGSAKTSLGDFHASRSAFAGGYEGMAALSFAITSHADLTLHYRYMVLSTAEDLTASSVGLGLRLRL
jgi:opacity protein-like surface antigen